MILPVADLLHIPSNRVFANTLLFDESEDGSMNGLYRGYDPTEPTSRDGGKANAIALLKRMYGLERVVMIGDGVTDMQAKPHADAFIGFGGVVVRGAVEEGADWFVRSFEVRPVHALFDPHRAFPLC